MPVEIQQFEVINDIPPAPSTPPLDQTTSNTSPDITDQLKKWHREAGVRHDRLRAD